MLAIVGCARAAPLRRFHDERYILLDLFIVSNWIVMNCFLLRTVKYLPYCLNVAVNYSKINKVLIVFLMGKMTARATFYCEDSGSFTEG